MDSPPNVPQSSRSPSEGWHCTHGYYRFHRTVLREMSADEQAAGRAELIAILTPGSPQAPQRLQVSVVSGHKADFGLMLMDPDPLCIDGVHQRLMASPLGPALESTYSFVSLSEVSEYVPTVEQYAERLIEGGEVRGTPPFEAKVRGYQQREPLMRQQRLYPDFPDWPVTCFYPMNKKRVSPDNWFLLPLFERNRLMAEHAQSGIAFAGKVTQLITVGIGLEDWEWGVTLWARSPEFLKAIVYRMRFDKASARYAEFGPFYTSYLMTAAEMLDHCHIGQSPAGACEDR